LDHSILRVVSPIVCQGREHFSSFLNEICEKRPIDQRGEGVILRDPRSWYFKKDSFFHKNVSKLVIDVFTTSSLLKRLRCYHSVKGDSNGNCYAQRLLIFSGQMGKFYRSHSLLLSQHLFLWDTHLITQNKLTLCPLLNQRRSFLEISFITQYWRVLLTRNTVVDVARLWTEQHYVYKQS
jgi:hypothetical protein